MSVHEIKLPTRVNVSCIAARDDRIAVGLDDGQIMIYNDNNCHRMPKYHAVAINSIAFSPITPAMFVSGCINGVINVWSHNKRLAKHRVGPGPRSPPCISFSRDYVFIMQRRRVLAWRTNNWTLPPVEIQYDSDTTCCYPQLSSDGRLLVSADSDKSNVLRLWHIRDNERKCKRGHLTADFAGTVQIPVSTACDLFYSSPTNATQFACGDRNEDDDGAIYDNGTIYIIDFISGTPHVRQLLGHTRRLNCLAYSPCGQQLVSRSFDNTMRLWDVASGACTRVLQGDKPFHVDIALMSGGKQLVTALYPHIIRVRTLCKWSERDHRLFSPDLRRRVVWVLCARVRLAEKNMPYEIWRMIIQNMLNM